MAFIPDSLTGAIFNKTRELHQTAKNLCERADEERYVDIAIAKGTITTLNTLCERIDSQARQTIEPLLKKIQKKLELAERAVQHFLKNDANSLDPRVKILIDKITQKNQAPLPRQPDEISAVHEKLQKWKTKLECISQPHATGPTKHISANAHSLIRGLEMQLLNAAPQFVIFDQLLTGKEFQFALFNESQLGGKFQFDHFYKDLKDLPNSAEWKQMACAPYAKNYLEGAVEEKDARFNHNGIGHYALERVHRWTANYIEKNQPISGISVENLFSQNDRPTLAPLPNATPLSFPFDAQENVIQKQIDALIDLKKSCNLTKPLGAFIELGPQTLALVLHHSGRISLCNPSGDKERPNCYEVNFGNSKQAAGFLKKLTAEVGSKSAVTFKPYCCLADEDRLKRGIESEEDDSEDGYGSDDNNVGTHNIDFNSLLLQFPSSSNTSQIQFFPTHSSQQFNSLTPPNFSTYNPTLNDLAPQVVSFKKIIEALSQKSEEGFFQVLTLVEEIKDKKWTFSMSDTPEQDILDRVYFHLYHIQDKETPDKINRRDLNWGLTAFQTEGESTPEQKLRAAQRVQVELLLDLVGTAIRKNDKQAIRLFFGALEQLQLDPRDLPKGETNAAHALFGKLYHTYVKEREEDLSLEDPLHAKFQSDFGRNAFLGNADADIPDWIERQAFQEIVQAFKETWRI